MAAELKARLTLNNSQFMRGLQGSLAAGKDFGRTLAKTGMLAGKAGFLALGAAAGVAAVGIYKAVNAAAEMEKSVVSFSVLLGSVEKAQARMKELADFAAATPFELPEIIEASRRLEVMTKGALATGRGLTLVGDVASGVGVEFTELATWIGRLYDGLQSGRPVGEAMMRLQEMGVISGDTRAEIERLSGPRAWAAAEKAFMRFFGMMSKQSKTWDGLKSTVSDNIGAGLRAAGEKIIDYLKPGLEKLAEVDFSRIGEAMGTELVGAAETFLGMIANPPKALAALGSLMDGVMAGAGNKLQQALETALNFFRDGFGSAVQGLGRILLASLLSSFSEAATYFQARIEAATNLLANPERAKLLGERVFQERALEVAEADKTRFGGLIAGPATRRAERAKSRIGEIDASLAGMDYSDLDVDAIAARIRAEGGPRVAMGAEGTMTVDQLHASGLALLQKGIADTQVAQSRDTFGAGAAFTQFGSRVDSLRRDGAGIRQGILNPSPIRARTIGEAQRIALMGREEGGREIMRMRAEREGTDAANLGLLGEIKNQLTSINQTMEVLK
jgi:ABC-type multidrug transport system fused ATPase/permease subunit